jgi:hypothetical protein
MADVKQEIVFRSIEDVVQGEGEFHDAQIRTEVASVSGEDRYHFLANFDGQLLQLGDREEPYLLGRIYPVE